MQGGPDAPTRDESETLVRDAQDGDAEAFAGLYEMYYGKIHRYVSFKTGGAVEAEDITVDVFLRMLESIKSFKWRGHPFSSWLFRIAHNLVVDHFRRKGRQKTAPLEAVSGLAGASFDDMDGRMDLKLSVAKVNEAMMGLTELQRQVLSLRFAGELSVLETAQAMGKKENAVKALQHAAIKKLRSLLEPLPDESRDTAVPQWSG